MEEKPSSCGALEWLGVPTLPIVSVWTLKLGSQTSEKLPSTPCECDLLLLLLLPPLFPGGAETARVVNSPLCWTCQLAESRDHNLISQTELGRL